MAYSTDRRTFLKSGLAAGAAAIIGRRGVAGLFASDPEEPVDLAVVKGTDYRVNARKAVDILGGAGKFVPKGGRVGLLINAPAWWKLPGSHVNADIVLATIGMCLEAGAGEIFYLLDPSPDIWKRGPLASERQAEIKAVKKCSGNYVETEVKGGLALKKASVIRELLDCDAWIDLSIGKNHEGTNFSGCLKNFMGACAGETNRFFHSGSGRGGGEYADVDFLSQCIADINLLRKPALALLDATLVLATNGPAGPGEIKRFEKIVAGTDRVAVDAYGAALLGRAPGEIAMLKKAAAHGLGRADLAGLRIREA
jgi:uncharacterized protein (DUF362 family)